MRIRIRHPDAVTPDGKIVPFHKRVVTIDGKDVAYLSLKPGGVLHLIYPLAGCVLRKVVYYVKTIDGKQPTVKTGSMLKDEAPPEGETATSN